MCRFGVMYWTEPPVMKSIEADSREEARQKLKALGIEGILIEVLDVQPSGKTSTLPPPARENHWANACGILSESRKPIATGSSGASKEIVMLHGKPTIIGGGGKGR